MDIKSIAKGAAAGTAVGLVCYAVTAASSKRSTTLRKMQVRLLKQPVLFLKILHQW